MSELAAAEDLYIPYWTSMEAETHLVVFLPEADEPVEVEVKFYDEMGLLLFDLFLPLEPRVPAVLNLAKEPNMEGEGALTLRCDKPINAEAIVMGKKKGDEFTIPAVNAGKGVWTTFAGMWNGGFSSLDDELIIFCPQRDLADHLLQRAILPGRPFEVFAREIVLDLYDGRGEPLSSRGLECQTVTRGTIRTMGTIEDGDAGSLGLHPMEVGPDLVLQDVVFIGYLRRYFSGDKDAEKTEKKQVQSGYMYSVKP
jgi:hypothetical protein